MIHPNMATMLGYVATDAAIAPGLMPQLVKEVCRLSFNCVTVDGDTSTNDSFILIATGQAGNAEIADLASADYAALKAALSEVAIAWRRRWRATAKGRPSSSSWRSKAAATVPNASRSPYANRALAAGQDRLFRQRPHTSAHPCRHRLSGVTDLDVKALQVYLGDVLVAEQGGRAQAIPKRRAQP